MPQAQMEEENEWKFPDDFPMRAKLEKVEERRFPYTIKRGERAGQEDVFYKWSWHFRIIGGEYDNLVAFADTEAKLTTHPENKVRQFAEVLLGKTFELGEGIDTDQLIGLECQIVCAHEKVQGKSGQVYKCPVVDLFPADTPSAVEDPWGAPAASDPWAAPGPDF